MQPKRKSELEDFCPWGRSIKHPSGFPLAFKAAVYGNLQGPVLKTPPTQGRGAGWGTKIPRGVAEKGKTVWFVSVIICQLAEYLWGEEMTLNIFCNTSCNWWHSWVCEHCCHRKWRWVGYFQQVGVVNKVLSRWGALFQGDVQDRLEMKPTLSRFETSL